MSGHSEHRVVVVLAWTSVKARFGEKSQAYVPIFSSASKQTHPYKKAASYHENLKITDNPGRVSNDFSVVQILD